MRVISSKTKFTKIPERVDMEKKVCVHLKGGLGNRLFQIAFLLGFVENNPSYTPCINNNYFSGYIEYQKRDDHTYFYNTLKSQSYHGTIITENYDDFAKYINYNIPERESLIFDGYFQNEKYFLHIKEKILRSFSPTNEVATRIKEKYTQLSNGVFLHVRRGDYVNHKMHWIDLTNYYKRCLEKFQNCHIFILSDDIDWCQKQSWIENLQKTFVMENEVTSLWLMTLCEKGGICSNSTFSWWGGWLNTNPERIIFYPSEHLNDKNIDTSDLASKTFTIMNV